MIRLTSTFLLAVLMISGVFAKAKAPNIIVLYSDDAGYADFGFQPNCSEDLKELTPNIDRIATEGARFSNAYMSGCVCSPSRAGLMTGIYQQRFGYDNNLPPGTQDGLPLEVTFGSKRLQDLGYHTGLIGKWHLGYPAEFHPNKRGFDWFYGLLQGSRPYFALESPSANRVIQENGEATPEDGYVTDRFGDAACRFIREQKEKPFFLFVSFTAPHGPLQPKESDFQKLEHITKKGRRNFAGLMVSLDANVGKILDCLEAEGLDESTVVVFTNDNGGQTALGANNHPLQGKKGTLLEGGVRVPWVMKWPGTITPGAVIDDPVIALDLVPTFVEVAGGEVKEEWKLDGVSLVPRLKTEVQSLPERPFFWRQHGIEGNRAMRMGEWKVHHDRKSGAAPRLYHLENDVAEAKDLASEQSDKLATMVEALDQWESQLQPPRWGPGSDRQAQKGEKRKAEKGSK